VEYTEGQFIGQMDQKDMPPPARELIRQYNTARRAGMRACPHLQGDSDEPAHWVSPLPDLLACKACAPSLREEIIRRGLRAARCLMCDEPAAVKNFSIAVGGVLLRGGVCPRCTPPEWGEL
jgi:hypothetical protein